MKIALISLTENGQILARNISRELEQDPTVIKIDIFHKNVKETLKDIFPHYDCIVGIMATGIIVRNICSLLKSKENDPAVLVIDEMGKHVISLVSGHLGGGNEFSVKIAHIIDGESVITTATDINNKFGVDTIARKYYLTINNISKIKIINSALLCNESIEIAFNNKFDFLKKDLDESYNKILTQSNILTVSKGNDSIELYPRKLVVGIGSRKNIDSETVIKAVKSALKILDLPIKRVDSLATGQMKQNESGIIDAASKLNIPLEIIPKESLKNFNNTDLAHSDFVMEKFGVFGVCEPSSLLAAGNDSTLIFRKTVYDGVTVAVAVSKNK